MAKDRRVQIKLDKELYDKVKDCICKPRGLSFTAAIEMALKDLIVMNNCGICGNAIDEDGEQL